MNTPCSWALAEANIPPCTQIHHQPRSQSCFFQNYPFWFLCPKVPCNFISLLLGLTGAFVMSFSAQCHHPLSYPTIFSEYFNVLWKFIGGLQLLLTVFQITAHHTEPSLLSCVRCNASLKGFNDRFCWDPFENTKTLQVAEPCQGLLNEATLTQIKITLTTWPPPHFHGFCRAAHYRLWGLQLSDHPKSL